MICHRCYSGKIIKKGRLTIRCDELWSFIQKRKTDRGYGQRISRLVWKRLSFSKNMENHAGAVQDFMHHYNTSIAG